MLKEPIKITYFCLVTLLLIFSSFTVLYNKKLHDKIYLKYLPEKIVHPQYSNKTGEVANRDEVTVWEYSDFVPWYGIVACEISYFFEWWGAGFFTLAFLFYIPALVYNLVVKRKHISIIYWLILAFELAACYYLIRLLPPP